MNNKHATLLATWHGLVRWGCVTQPKSCDRKDARGLTNPDKSHSPTHRYEDISTSQQILVTRNLRLDIRTAVWLWWMGCGLGPNELWLSVRKGQRGSCRSIKATSAGRLRPSLERRIKSITFAISLWSRLRKKKKLLSLQVRKERQPYVYTHWFRACPRYRRPSRRRLWW